MKQNDWIVIGVAAVLSIGGIIYSITQARTAEVPPPPTQVPTNKVEIPKTPIVYQNGLPGADGQVAGGGAGGGGEETLGRAGRGGRGRGSLPGASRGG